MRRISPVKRVRHRTSRAPQTRTASRETVPSRRSPLQRLESVVGPDHAQQRIDRVVQSMLPAGASRSQVQGLFDADAVALDGATCREVEQPVSAGQRIAVEFEPGRRYKPRPRSHTDAGFRVLFEDEHLIVVDKSAALLTVPTDKRERNTLVHRLAIHVNRGRGGGRTRGKGLQRVDVVHRLDRGVSGILVFAKYGRIAEALKSQFEARKPRREYVAIVAGVLAADQGTFRSHLATAANLDQRSVPAGSGGKLAVTHYRVLRRLRDATIVSIRLETGRRNQIRVHLAEAGHPVLGDPRYLPEIARKHRLWMHNRMALHARSLSFEHPVTHRTMSFESLPPGAFRALMGESSDPSQRIG